MAFTDFLTEVMFLLNACDTHRFIIGEPEWLILHFFLLLLLFQLSGGHDCDRSFKAFESIQCTRSL